MFGALLQYQMVDEMGELPRESQPQMHGKGIAVPCVNKEAFFVCAELKTCSSLTGLAKLQQFVCFFPLLLGTFCSCWWLKGGSFLMELQQEVFTLDKRKDYLAECRTGFPGGLWNLIFIHVLSY